MVGCGCSGMHPRSSNAIIFPIQPTHTQMGESVFVWIQQKGGKITSVNASARPQSRREPFLWHIAPKDEIACSLQDTAIENMVKAGLMDPQISNALSSCLYF